GGCFGIFGHGNVAGIGEALYESPELLTYYQARNEQSMVHTAAVYARMRNRLATLACTTSIGPGATNMVTGAALATVNRLPVLLLPGDVFASRRPDPVLQQLETPWAGDASVNETFRPVSRYFDRLWRPEQVVSAAMQALRALCEQTGIPVGETQAGKGSLPYDHPSNLGAIGVTGTFAANRIAAGADLVIGVGTRWSDFTTASKTAFRNPDVRFVNVNVADFDAQQHAGVALVGDARLTLIALGEALYGFP